MVVNADKTKFFVINGNEIDKEPLVFQNSVIEYCRHYLYLGAWFSDDGNMKSILELHENSSLSLINKFAIFCSVNTTMPFSYKMKVFRAAVMSSLFYSSESWLTSNINSIEKSYNKLVRILLGVRNNVPILLCLAELGLNTAKYEVEIKRKSFLDVKLRNVDTEEPFHFVFEMCRRNNTPGYRILKKCIEGEISGLSIENIHTMINEKPESATKYSAYRSKLNIDLVCHPVYKDVAYVPDFKRQAFTRLRLMSHNLKIETGRWNRTPRDARLCICSRNEVQDEEHVLLFCPLSRHLRDSYQQLNFSSIGELINGGDIGELYNYIFRVLELYL